MGAFGSFEVVKQLLEAKADPTKTTAGNGFDAFMCAAIFGNHKHIAAWIQYFDGASAFLERTELTVGQTPLLIAAGQAPNGGEETVQTLLDAKASLHSLDDAGNSALAAAADNVNGTAGLVAQLVRAGADVNLRTIPRTRK